MLRCSCTSCRIQFTLICFETPTAVAGLFGFSCSSTSSKPPKVALLPCAPFKSFSGMPPKICLPLNFEVMGTPGTWCREVTYVGSSPSKFFPGAVAGLRSSSKSTNSCDSKAPEAVEGRTFFCVFTSGILNTARVRTVLLLAEREATCWLADWLLTVPWQPVTTSFSWSCQSLISNPDLTLYDSEMWPWEIWVQD